ncbi:MAG: type II toxin-antitoxin system HicB family antitoxin [Candidatus Poribacteria bacterium]|nr:type II toxin-antitoxin system HicB family antitoxin [Candidatus Poribacteria bacterium]
MKFNAVFKKVPEGYIGFVEELPGANTQGKTLEEARANLREAIELTLAANRALAEEDIAELQDVIREPISVRL